jgi:hypothetical protein
MKTLGKHVIFTDETFQGIGLDKQLKTTNVVNGGDVVRFGVIPKANLALGPYQRPEDTPRVDRIRKNWHPDFGVINLYEFKHGNKYYYTIPDGQHRAKANPNEAVIGIITNTYTAPELFILANSNMKTVGQDDKFWAHYYNGDKSPVHHFVHDYLVEKWGITPQRATNENRRNKEFCCVSYLYKYYEILLKSETSQVQDGDAEGAAEEEAKRKFEFLCEIMFGTFGKTAFHSKGSNKWQGYSSAWLGMMKVLDFPSVGWNNHELKVQCFSKGLYSKNGMGQASKDTLDTIESVIKKGMEDYPENAQNERTASVLLSMYRHGVK